ncbi:hypothetical protein BDV18DRAFT_12883 [Aspergillus unguis]
MEELQAQIDNKTNWEDPSFAERITLNGDGVKCTMDEPGYNRDSGTLVDHCLTVPSPETCELYVSLPLCLVVLACNVSKLVCTLLAAKDKREDIFLTTGDAIASYLACPDPTTEGCCLLSKQLVKKEAQDWHSSGIKYDEEDDRKLALPLPRPSRWIHAVGKTQWFLTTTVCVCILTPSIWLLYQGMDRYGMKSIFEYGLGAISRANVFIPILEPFTTSGILSMILLANVPQLLVSIAYFTLNALLTGMLGAVEYDSYGLRRQPLRVSWPRGKQTSTYYLSLPYRYSVPLLLASAVLHWLVSQSLFYAQIVPFDVQGQHIDGAETVSCGYAPVAIVFAIVVGGSLFLASILLGLRRFKSSMPLAGQCSAVISAACHVSSPSADDDLNHALRPVQWGETGDHVLAYSSQIDGLAGVEHGVESSFFHCSFSAGEVDEPKKGRLYI